MDTLFTAIKLIVAFFTALVFLVGLLSVCNYQVQIVQGQGMQLVSTAVAQDRYED